MARKPNTQPSPEATPARRSRKTKVAALSAALPLATDVDNPVLDDAGSGVPEAAPTKAPGRREPGRKPKQAAKTGTTASVQDEVAGSQGQAPGRPEAEASPGLTGDDGPTAAAASDPVQPDLDPGTSDNEAPQSFSEAGASVSAKPAAHWDRTTDRVRFDWPVIEQAVAQDGPNQGMAKLLAAARAEGAQSRWPF